MLLRSFIYNWSSPSLFKFQIRALVASLPLNFLRSLLASLLHASRSSISLSLLSRCSSAKYTTPPSPSSAVAGILCCSPSFPSQFLSQRRYPLGLSVAAASTLISFFPSVERKAALLSVRAQRRCCHAAVDVAAAKQPLSWPSLTHVVLLPPSTTPSPFDDLAPEPAPKALSLSESHAAAAAGQIHPLAAAAIRRGPADAASTAQSSESSRYSHLSRRLSAVTSIFLLLICQPLARHHHCRCTLSVISPLLLIGAGVVAIQPSHHRSISSLLRRRSSNSPLDTPVKNCI